MPLFAYSIARGYEYSRQKNTIPRYVKKLAAFAAVSQLPYSLMAGNRWNIGLTWLFSLLLLISIDREDRSRLVKGIEVMAILAAAYLLNIDYGIYGVLMPLHAATEVLQYVSVSCCVMGGLYAYERNCRTNSDCFMCRSANPICRCAAGQQDKTSQVFLLCVLSGTHPTIGNSETDYIVKGERP